MATAVTAPGGRPAWLPVAPYAFVFLWSMGYVMAVVGQMSAGTLTLLALRYATCVVLLLPLLPFLSVRFPTDAKSLSLIALNGFLIHVVHFGGVWSAMAHGVPVGVVALVLSLQPVLTAVAAPFLAGERVTRRVWIGLFLGLAGTTIVIVSRSEIGGFPPALLGLTILGLLAFTLATLLDRRFGGKHHPVGVNLIQFIVAAAVTIPAAILFEGFAHTWTPGLFVAVAYLAIGNSFVALTLFLAMVRFGEAARVASLMYLVPPGAAVFGWLILDQPIPPVLWAGMALACAGVWLAVRPARSAAP